MAKQYIEISIPDQTLCLKQGDEIISQYSVSTATNGAGEKEGSECTPRGKHVVAEKIGAGSKLDTVFVGRVPTGEIYEPSLREKYPDRDWILTRILRLRGTEPGFNCGCDVDSFERYIYIHGSPDYVAMGTPGSHGCVRMRNEDVIELFDKIECDIPVIING